jgi:hypothetical protein
MRSLVKALVIRAVGGKVAMRAYYTKYYPE